MKRHPDKPTLDRFCFHFNAIWSYSSLIDRCPQHELSITPSVITLMTLAAAPDRTNHRSIDFQLLCGRECCDLEMRVCYTIIEWILQHCLSPQLCTCAFYSTLPFLVRNVDEDAVDYDDNVLIIMSQLFIDNSEENHHLKTEITLLFTANLLGRSKR